MSYEPALTHRFSIAIDLSGSARELWRRTTRSRISSRTAARSRPTNSSPRPRTAPRCHVRFAEHGGPRRDVEYCVVCHNPGTIDPDSGESVDLAYMAHSIHRGENRSTSVRRLRLATAKSSTRAKFTYPQPITFCETCHTAVRCNAAGRRLAGLPRPAACGGCHDAGLNKTGPSATTGRYTYTFTHPVGALPPDFLTFGEGECRGCHKPGGSGGDILEVHKRDEDRKAHRERRAVHLQDHEGRERRRRPGAEGDVPDPARAAAGQRSRTSRPGACVSISHGPGRTFTTSPTSTVTSTRRTVVKRSSST